MAESGKENNYSVIDFSGRYLNLLILIIIEI